MRKALLAASLAVAVGLATGLTSTLIQTEEALVREWRLSSLLALEHDGRPAFDVTTAEVLATADVDLHELQRLLARGCPPELAAQILL
jgi:hypothetical protein